LRCRRLGVVNCLLAALVDEREFLLVISYFSYALVMP
jgi:hypothetical protein